MTFRWTYWLAMIGGHWQPINTAANSALSIATLVGTTARSAKLERIRISKFSTSAGVWLLWGSCSIRQSVRLRTGCGPASPPWCHEAVFTHHFDADSSDFWHDWGNPSEVNFFTSKTGPCGGIWKTSSSRFSKTSWTRCTLIRYWVIKGKHDNFGYRLRRFYRQ